MLLGTTVVMVIANVPADYLELVARNIVPLGVVSVFEEGLSPLVGVLIQCRASGSARRGKRRVN